MSAIPNQDRPTLEQREKAWSCDTDDKKVRLKVEQDGKFWELPTIAVETQVKKGISSRDTFTRAKVPIQWQGYRTVDLLDSWGQRTSDDPVFDVCKVEWYDDITDEWVLTQTGWLRGISGTDQNGVVKLVISGFEQLLSEISASKSFSDATYQDVLSYIGSELNEIQFSDVHNIETYRINSGNTEEYIGDISLGETVTGIFKKQVSVEPVLGPKIANLGFTKNFKSNEHTVIDVIEYITETTDDEWYFDESGNLVSVSTKQEKNLQSEFVDKSYISDSNELSLFIEEQIEDSPIEGVETENVSGIEPELQITVHNNNALMEISPINAAWVEGDTVGSISNFFGLSDAKRSNATKTYPYAVAWYPRLMSNDPTAEELLPSSPNDPRPAVGKTFSTSHKTISAAENAAKKKLKEEITTVGEGDMRIRGKPFIVPDDKITAYPVQCDLVVSEDVFEYNVESVTHRQVEGGTYESIVDCTVYVDESEIETASTTLEI